MSEQFNQLTPSQHERLAILSEELGEAQQAIGKILRHGYDSRNTDLDTETEFASDNRANLEKELGDVAFAVDMLIDNGDVSKYFIGDRVRSKAEKIKPYLHHQGKL